jgi:hypothetical protein
VIISKRLKQKYPEEMTIVLQHQFRELTVDDHRFEVTLSFNNLPERLTVPLRAVRVFFDPSVRYGIQFENSDLVSEGADETELQEADAVEAGGDRPPAAARRPGAPALAEPGENQKPRSTRKPRVGRTEGDDAMPGPPALGGSTDMTGAAESGESVLRRQPGRPKLVRPNPERPVNPANDAKVVQLDKFRKR